MNPAPSAANVRLSKTSLRRSWSLLLGSFALAVAPLSPIVPFARADTPPDKRPDLPANSPKTLPRVAHPAAGPHGWTLIFADEFDGNALDASKWTHLLPWGNPDEDGNRHHNDQYASFIKEANVQFGGGKLRLIADKEEVTDKAGHQWHYTQGFVHTRGKFDATYGYYEARLRVPVEAGPGLWPAFWTLTEGWPPENDIAEFWTAGAGETHQGLCYRPQDGGGEKWDNRHRAGVPAGFHTYALEWGPGYEIFYIDAKPNHAIYGDQVPAVPMYLILNSGVSAPRGPTDKTIFPNSFEVDYVRAYQRDWSTPILHNPGLEDDALGAWGQWHDGTRTTDRRDIHGGKAAMKLTGSPSSIEQKVFGLKPNTTYTFSGQIKADAGTAARLGVKNYGGDETFQTSDSNGTWTTLCQTFTTGDKSTTAAVFAMKASGDGAACVDDFSLVEVKQ